MMQRLHAVGIPFCGEPVRGDLFVYPKNTKVAFNEVQPTDLLK